MHGPHMYVWHNFRLRAKDDVSSTPTAVVFRNKQLLVVVIKLVVIITSRKDILCFRTTNREQLEKGRSRLVQYGPSGSVFSYGFCDWS